MTETILIIQAESAIESSLTDLLTDNGYTVKTVSADTEPYMAIPACCPSLIILTSKSECHRIIEIVYETRKWCYLPILIISDNCSEKFIAAALDAGADDFLSNPVGNVEFLARVRTSIRHTRIQASCNGSAELGVFKVGNLVINYDKHKVTVSGKEVHLTLNEYKIITLLSKYPGKTLSHEYILNQIWGNDVNKNDTLIVRVNMSNLRRKIEEDPSSPRYICTEVGVGYKLAEEEPSTLPVY